MEKNKSKRSSGGKDSAESESQRKDRDGRRRVRGAKPSKEGEAGAPGPAKTQGGKSPGQRLRRLLKLLGRLSPTRLGRWARRRAGLSWRRPRQVRLPHALLWVDVTDDSLGHVILKHGEYERGWTEWLRTAIRPGSRAVDIGANIGYYTVLLGQLVGPGGRVLAFEPEPNNFALLERNLRDNGLDNVETFQAALTEAPGRVSLHINERHHGVHSLGADNCSYRRGRVRVEVEALRLDDVLEARGLSGSVSFVKLDAQGAEELILRGSRRLLQQESLTLLLEIWPRGLEGCGTTLEELLGELESAGFEPSLLAKSDPPGLRPVSWARVREKGERCAAAQHSSFNVVFEKGRLTPPAPRVDVAQ